MCQFIGSLHRSLSHLPAKGSPSSHPVSKGPIVAAEDIEGGPSVVMVLLLGSVKVVIGCSKLPVDFTWASRSLSC